MGNATHWGVDALGVDRSFIYVEAAWTARDALALLEALEARWVIIYRVHEGCDYFYARWRKQLMRKLAAAIAAGDSASVTEALELDERSTPAIPMGGRLPQDTAVVVEEGLVAGVLVPPRVDRATRDLIGQGALEAMPATSLYLATSLPARLVLGARASLIVKITGEDTRGAAALSGARMGDELDLVVETAGAVSIEGPSDATLRLTEEHIAHRFSVKGERLGTGKITVYAFQDGTQIGRVKVETVVVAASADEGAVQQVARIQPVQAPPELALYVFERKAERSYEVRVTAADPKHRLNMAKFGPVQLDHDVEAFFGAFYKDIEDILRSSGSAQDKLDQLGVKGGYLFEKVVPSELRARLWRLREQIRSIHIQSEEPWVPWELCRLTGTDDTGYVAEGDFLCEQFAITRWLMESPQHTELTLTDIGLVIPPDVGLPAAIVEQAFIQGLAGPDRKVTPIAAHFVKLREALGRGIHDALHFAGHGLYHVGDADRSAIQLAGDQRFTPQHLTGVTWNLGRKKPLVFLNACEIGRSGTTLGSMAGWPRAFLAAGAGAFIGSYWKISDVSASSFAQIFYETLLSGATVGEAVQTARCAVKAADDPTWIAYTVFAHWDARVVAANAPAGENNNGTQTAGGNP